MRKTVTPLSGDQMFREHSKWYISASATAMMMALSSSPAMAQNVSNAPTTEIVVDSNDTVGDFVFNTSVGISPVLIGSDGDILFRASNFGEARFVVDTGNPNLLNRTLSNGVFPIRANLGASVPQANYSVADVDNGYAVIGRLAADGNQAYIGLFDDTDDNDPQNALLGLINGADFFDQGNLFDGAIPIVNDDNIAVLISNIANEQTMFPGVFNTTNIVALSTDFGQSYREIGSLDGATSLRFAGSNRIFGSLNNAVSSPNSASVDQIVFFDTDIINTDAFGQVGPNVGGFSYGGYSFFTRTPGVANFGEGVQFQDARFSVVGNTGVFTLTNVETALDGSPGDDLVTQAIFLEDLAPGSNTETALLVMNTTSSTSIGDVRFEAVDDLVVSASGEVFFSGRARDTGNNEILPISYWRIDNPGAVNQRIVPVLAPGTVLNTIDGTQFTIAGQPTGFTERSLAIDTNLRDGRAQLLSVNSQGRAALYAFLDLGFGNVIDALVAQSDDGTFHIVTYVGQKVEIDGVERTVEDFTFQFGSNDIDGFGDGYNADEQLAYQLFFTDNSFAVARTSLNGPEANPDITNYLWRGDCGDDEFSTICRSGGDDASNWVNADDIGQVADAPPGGDPAPQNAFISGADVRISVADVSINRLESDAKLTLQDGRTLTLAGGGDINQLIIEDGTVSTGDQLAVNDLRLDRGTVNANSLVVVEDNLAINGGRLAGAIGIDVDLGGAIQSTPPQALITGNVELATRLRFFDNSNVRIDNATLDIENNGQIALNDGSDLVIDASTITGNGSILVDGASASITSEGLTFVSASVTFNNADASRLSDSAPDLLRVASRTLNARELLFSAQNPVDIVTNSGAGIAIDPGATLEIADGGRLVVQSFVEVKQTPGSTPGDRPSLVLGRGSTLGIDFFGTLNVNLGPTGDFIINNANVTGGGLLVNQSILQSVDSNFEVVFANLGGAAFSGNNRIATSANAANTRRADDLFRRGVEIATGVDLGAGAGPAFSISALLVNASFLGGENRITGDGVAFLIDNRIDGGRLDSDAPTLIASDITTAQQGVFSIAGGINKSGGLAVLADMPQSNLNNASASFIGNGFVLLESIDIEGLISPNNPQFKFANLTNELGKDYLAANPTILTGTNAVDPSPGGFLSIENSSLENLTLVNDGSARIEAVTFKDSSSLFNRGLLNLAGSVTDESEVNGQNTAFIVNEQGARLQLTGIFGVGVPIDNFGLLSAGGNDRSILLSELNVIGEGSVRGRHSVIDGATVTALKTNALSAPESAAAVGAGPGVGLTGFWFVDNASVILQDGSGNTPDISWIAPEAFVEIFKTSRLNNLGETIDGIRLIQGTLRATESTLNSDKLTIDDGLVRLDTINIAGDLRLEDGVLRIQDYDFTNAVVTDDATIFIRSDATRSFTERTRNNNLTITNGNVFIERGNIEEPVDSFSVVSIASDGLLGASGVDIRIGELSVEGTGLITARDLAGDNFELTGDAMATIRNADFERITVNGQSQIDFSAGIFADTVNVEGKLLAPVRADDGMTPLDTPPVSEIGALTISAGGMARFNSSGAGSSLTINNLTVDEGGAFALIDDNIDGFNVFTIDNLIANGMVVFDVPFGFGIQRTLIAENVTIGGDGILDVGGATIQTENATVGNILRGNRFDFVENFTVQANAMVNLDQLNGVVSNNSDPRLTNQGGTVTIDGTDTVLSGLRVAGNGEFNIMGNADIVQLAISTNSSSNSNWIQQGNLNVGGQVVVGGLGDFILEGALDVKRDAFFNNRIVTVTGRANIQRQLIATVIGTGRFNNDVTVGGFARFGGQWSIAGNLNVADRVIQDGPVNDTAGSTEIVGNATIAGDLNVRTGGSFVVGGDLTVSGMVIPDTPPAMAAAGAVAASLSVTEDNGHTSEASAPSVVVAAEQPILQRISQPENVPMPEQVTLTASTAETSLVAAVNGAASPLMLSMPENAPQGATPALMLPENEAQNEAAPSHAALTPGFNGLTNGGPAQAGLPGMVPLPIATAVDNGKVTVIAAANNDEEPAQNIPAENEVIATAINAQADAADLVESVISGTLMVGGNATIMGGVAIDMDAMMQIGGDGTFDRAIVDGSLIVGGDLVADALTVNGLAQFDAGSFGELTVGSDGMLIGNGFETDGNFTNLGTFQLGNPDNGAGNFNIGGIFRQAGIFSGTGTIAGNFVQEAVAGGPDAGDILLSPGFSPGILNITGDATFNDGMVLFEIGGLTPGVDHDQINVTGNLTIGQNAMIVVDLLELADGSGIFLPQTGDEIVIFTASDISPDDVEQINFAVIDELPLGFTLVPDIAQNTDGEIFRVLRGFNGSTLSVLDGLDQAQIAVAGAIDFLSAAESGVPSPELFQLAVDLQFNEDGVAQRESLTALSATGASAIQANALRAGSFGMQFAKNRLNLVGDNGSGNAQQSQIARAAPRLAVATQAPNGGSPQSRAMLADVVTKNFEAAGGSITTAGESTIRLLGGISYHIGDNDARNGTVGFDQDGWSANAAIEYENTSQNLLFGLAGTIGNIDAGLHNRLGSVDTDSLAITAYGRYDAGIVQLAAGYSIADLDFDSSRQVLGATATASFSGTSQTVLGRVRADLVKDDALDIGPLAAIQHFDIDVDSYSETGAGALNLSVTALDRQATELDLGAFAKHQFDVDGWQGNFHISAVYSLSLSGDNFTAIQTAFTAASNTTFANPLRPLQSNGVEVSADLKLASQDGVSLSLGYDGFFGSNGEEYNDFGFKLGITF